MTATQYGAYSWRVSAEVDNYDHAVMLGRVLVQTHPRKFLFQALDANGEPLWQEDGDPDLRPKDMQP